MVIFIQAEQRHHDARSAIPALAAVVVYHFLLHGMKRIGISQILDRYQLFSMYHGQKDQATVDGFIPELPFLVFSNYHGTGTAVAFGKALLNAFMKRERTQVIGTSGSWF